MAGELDELKASFNRIRKIEAELSRTTDYATRRLLQRRLSDAKEANSQAVKRLPPEVMMLIREQAEQNEDTT